jgi:transposase
MTDRVEVEAIVSGHTSTRKSARSSEGEVLAGPERRRRWSTEEKLRVLAQSMAPGSSVSLACRLNGIGTGQLYTWRRQFLSGELTGFAPVAVLTEGASAGATLPAVRPGVETLPSTAAAVSGAMEIELPSGARVRVTPPVDAAVLRLVLSVLS